MKYNKCHFYCVFLGLFLFFSGCATTQERLLDSDSSQVQLRSIQSRTFDTTDKEKTLRTIMATLQDLGFVIDQADSLLGTVTATSATRARPRSRPGLPTTPTPRPNPARFRMY